MFKYKMFSINVVKPTPENGFCKDIRFTHNNMNGLTLEFTVPSDIIPLPHWQRFLSDMKNNKPATLLETGNSEAQLWFNPGPNNEIHLGSLEVSLSPDENFPSTYISIPVCDATPMIEECISYLEERESHC